MTDANAEIVRSILGAWEQGDFRSQAEHLDPEIRFETFMPDAAQNVTAHGLVEVESFTREWLAQWRDYRIVAEEVRAVGQDRVLVFARQVGSGRHSGVAVDSPGFCVFTIRHGRVVNLSLHYDRREALDAAGVET